jgi:hypothetical protein
VSVWGGESISNRLEGPDKAVKYTLDLTQAHNDESLIADGVLQPDHAPFSYINILKVGSGVWSLKMVLGDGSTIVYNSTEVSDGYIIHRRFGDLKFTNAAQSGLVDPVFIIEWFSR